MKLERLRLRAPDRAIVRRAVALGDRAVRAIATDRQGSLGRRREDDTATFARESHVRMPEPAPEVPPPERWVCPGNRVNPSFCGPASWWGRFCLTNTYLQHRIP